MEPKLHRRVQRYGWDRAVEDYERYFLPALRHCSERCVEMLQPRPGERILDVATGPGVAAFIAAEQVGRLGRVVATDISDNMIEVVREEAQRRGVINMDFERMDAEALALPEASFDGALCVLGLMFPADPQRAIDEIYRVLKPGGRAAVCVWGRRERCGWSPIFPIVESRVETEVCPLFFQLGLEGALTLAFTQAGFAVKSEERLTRSLDFPGDREMLAAVFKGGAVALAYSRFSDETREEAHREFLEEVASYRNNGGYSLPGEFVFALAEKT